MVSGILGPVAGVIATMLALLPSCGWAQPMACNDLLPAPHSKATRSRSISPKDLIELRDIGPSSSVDVRSRILSLSPDGSQVAFQIRRANIEDNSYCFGIFVADVRNGKLPVAINIGGAYIPTIYSAHGFAAHTTPGTAITVTPKWSPDGRWIAFLRRDGGKTQAWVARSDGSYSEAITNLDFDVEDVAWSHSGTAVLISGRPGLTLAEREIDQEGRSGFLFDDRFKSVGRPMPREPIPVRYFAINLRSKTIRNASAEEEGNFLAHEAGKIPSDAILGVQAPRGRVGWTAVTDESNITSQIAVHARYQDGREASELMPRFSRVSNIWWADDQDTLFFLRTEGWGNSQQGLYRWRRGAAPEPILLTDDVLIGCDRAGVELVCGRESSAHPRRLVRIDLNTGSSDVIFDPNPLFSSFRLGKITRLKWKNDRGIETFGDLVMPLNMQAGKLYPLVVVQYHSRGFLRGGTGDDYPVQAFAARGFAVLSFQSPLDIGTFEGRKTWEEVARANVHGLAERWSILSSLERGVQLAIDSGPIDGRRVGLTGLSDGSATVSFALVNSTMFSAVAMSNCCDEPSVVSFLNGPALEREYHTVGFPSLTAPDDNFWRPYSLRMNASRIDTPILMQVPDDEYIAALESYTALSEMRKPVELYVFPNEYHIKWQPIHRLASYMRSLEWFDFWLKGVEDLEPQKRTQYRRWERLRESSRLESDRAPVL